PESIRGQTILYSILLPRCRHCGCIPQSFRWRVLDPRTGEAQAADLGYVVACTSREARSGGRLWQKEMAMIGKNRGMIYGAKTGRILAGVLTVASGGGIILILLGYLESLGWGHVLGLLVLFGIGVASLLTQIWFRGRLGVRNSGHEHNENSL